MRHRRWIYTTYIYVWPGKRRMCHLLLFLPRNAAESAACMAMCMAEPHTGPNRHSCASCVNQRCLACPGRGRARMAFISGGVWQPVCAPRSGAAQPLQDPHVTCATARSWQAKQNTFLAHQGGDQGAGTMLKPMQRECRLAVQQAWASANALVSDRSKLRQVQKAAGVSYGATSYQIMWHPCTAKMRSAGDQSRKGAAPR